MPNRLVQHTAAAILCAAITPVVAQTTTFTSQKLSFAGNTNIFATAINASGTIVGTVFDNSAKTQFAFEIAAGTPTTLPNPGGAFGPFVPEEINDLGAILGYAKNSGVGITDLFLLKSASFDAAYQQPLVEPGNAQNDTPLPVSLSNNLKVSFDTIYSITGPIGTHYGLPPHFRTVPPQNRYTHVNSINNVGTVAGIAYSLSGITSVYYGSGKSFTTVVPSGAVSTFGGFINNAGTVAGSYRDAAGSWHGFTDTASTITTFDMPQPATRIAVSAINATGRVVGVFTDSTANQHAFLWNGTVATSFGHYAASDTVALAISNRGAIVVSRQLAASAPSYDSYLVHCHGPGC